jgi:rhodanese-related sulfurtransferase
VRDASCYISARELARWRRGPDLVIVDARPAAEFRRVRIPGSINLPVRSLLSRAYLRPRHVLLVDRGYLGGELEASCRELRAAGFASVAIVEGGLHAWAQTIGDLEGDRAARNQLDRIAPRDFSRATRFDHWLVVDVSAAPAPDLDELLPGAQRAPLGGDPAAFRQQLAKLIQAREGGQGALFLGIVDADDSRYAEVGRALSSLGVVHAFFLDGGLEAYRGFDAARRARQAQAQVLGEPACESR